MSSILCILICNDLYCPLQWNKRLSFKISSSWGMLPGSFSWADGTERTFWWQTWRLIQKGGEQLNLWQSQQLVEFYDFSKEKTTEDQPLPNFWKGLRWDQTYQISNVSFVDQDVDSLRGNNQAAKNCLDVYITRDISMGASWALSRNKGSKQKNPQPYKQGHSPKANT